MSCSKCKTFGWHENLPAVYTDDKGEKYCVFHAPQGKKEISVEKFNKLIFEKINEAKKSNSKCILSGTIFEGNIAFGQFNKDNPLPEINLILVTFSESANFTEATFDREANFIGAKFNKEVDFWKTTFNKEAKFMGAIFNKRTSFWEMTFNKEADFWLVTFREKTTFMKVKFSIRANFTELPISEKIRFEGVNLSTVSFIDTDLTRIDFISCDWAKSNGRNVLYDEICLFRNKEEKTSEDKKTKNILNRFKQGLKQWLYPDRERIKKVEILYRQLKRKCKEDHNDVDISDWHYGEKEMVRKSKRLRKILSLYSLYWLSSGYGERPKRAGIVLICLILLVSVLFGFAGLIPNSEPRLAPINEIKDLVKNPFEVLVNTLQYATFEKDTYFMPQNIWGTFLKILAKLFIPLQAALFAFSVRNRFKR